MLACFPADPIDASFSWHANSSTYAQHVNYGLAGTVSLAHCLYHRSCILYQHPYLHTRTGHYQHEQQDRHLHIHMIEMLHILTWVGHACGIIVRSCNVPEKPVIYSNLSAQHAVPRRLSTHVPQRTHSSLNFPQKEQQCVRQDSNDITRTRATSSFKVRFSS